MLPHISQRGNAFLQADKKNFKKVLAIYTPAIGIHERSDISMKMTNENHIRIDGEALAAELGYVDLIEMRVSLSKMSNMKLGELKMEELSDLTEIEIDETLTEELQVLSLLRQTRNPYYYRYEGMIVTISDRGKAQLEHFLSKCLF